MDSELLTLRLQDLIRMQEEFPESFYELYVGAHEPLKSALVLKLQAMNFCNNLGEDELGEMDVRDTSFKVYNLQDFNEEKTQNVVNHTWTCMIDRHSTFSKKDPKYLQNFSKESEHSSSSSSSSSKEDSQSEKNEQQVD